MVLALALVKKSWAFRTGPPLISGLGIGIAEMLPARPNSDCSSETCRGGQSRATGTSRSGRPDRKYKSSWPGAPKVESQPARHVFFETHETTADSTGARAETSRPAFPRSGILKSMSLCGVKRICALVFTPSTRVLLQPGPQRPGRRTVSKYRLFRPPTRTVAALPRNGWATGQR